MVKKRAQKPKSQVKRPVLIAALVVAIALVGAGFYFFMQHKQRVINNVEPEFDKTTAPSVPAPAHPKITPHSIWKPAPKTSWQWQLSVPVDTSVDAEMYDIDLFTNDASVVDTLHAKNRKVVCYISAGSVENWRPDADQFPAEVIGKDYAGWEGEKWLDIRRIDVIGPIMLKRLDQCRDKGFDAVEPDSILGYTQDTGFPLTYQDQLNFNRWFAKASHDRGLSIGLKEDPDQAADLVGDFDWALDEECFEFHGCDNMTPFIKAGKAVFNTEYALDSSQFCADANARNFNSIRKHKELDAYRETCR